MERKENPIERRSKQIENGVPVLITLSPKALRNLLRHSRGCNISRSLNGLLQLLYLDEVSPRDEDWVASDKEVNDAR